MLVDACAALDIANTLEALPLGVERQAERLYDENQLTAVGHRQGRSEDAPARAGHCARCPDECSLGGVQGETWPVGRSP